MVWTTAPVEASISVTVLSPSFATQTWVPSDETAWGKLPTPTVPTTAPVEASSSVTEPPPSFATQTWVPSDEMPSGPLPTAMVWATVPVEASSSVTELPPLFATQTWVPSEETAEGPTPTGIVWTTCVPKMIVPARSSVLMPFLAWHKVARFEGASRPTSALPENDPVALVPLTVVAVKVAFPAYVVPSTKPLTLPFHTTLSDADAPVVELVTQLRGLLANEPVTFPTVMVTSLLLGVQPDNVPFTVDGLVPPPESVTAGENDTLADREQLTESPKPGAAPVYLGSGLAAAGWASG